MTFEELHVGARVSYGRMGLGTILGIFPYAFVQNQPQIASVAVGFDEKQPFLHHAGGLAPEGNGYYVTSTDLEKIIPIDVGDLEDDY